MRKVALATGGVLLALALGLGIPALMTHAEERAAWRAEREKQGTPSYDAAASDAHYRASRQAWQASALPGHLLGAGLVLFTLGAIRPRQPETESRKMEAESRLRRGAALMVDLVLGGALLALHGLDAGESAAIHALTGAAPWLAALPLVPRVGGRSLGMRLFGLHR